MNNIYLCSKWYFRGKVKEVEEIRPFKDLVKRIIPIPLGSSPYCHHFSYIEYQGDYYLDIDGLDIEDGYVKLAGRNLLSALGIDPELMNSKQ